MNKAMLGDLEKQGVVGGLLQVCRVAGRNAAGVAVVRQAGQSRPALAEAGGQRPSACGSLSTPVRSAAAAWACTWCQGGPTKEGNKGPPRERVRLSPTAC